MEHRYKFDTIVKKFVYFLENKGEYKERYAKEILERSKAVNKEEILEELIKQVNIFREYDENESRVDFNYKPFCREFEGD